MLPARPRARARTAISWSRPARTRVGPGRRTSAAMASRQYVPNERARERDAWPAEAWDVVRLPLSAVTPKHAVSTVDGQMQSSRPPSSPVRNLWTAPGRG